MRIIFMGTPDFAIPSLRILVESGYEVVGVVTAPDQPAGRGRNVLPSPIKAYAESAGLKILQPTNLKSPEFLHELQALKPDLAVVVAFRMLPSVVWKIPKLGTFNLHASLLPDYRGAAPINWAIINGEKETGLTTFLIDQQIDTGAILLQKRTPIPSEWSAGDLHDHLMELGAGLVLETVKLLSSGKANPSPQDESRPRNPAPKIFKEDCRINWKQPAGKVLCFIRGLSPYPAAWTQWEDKSLKIFEASLTGKGTEGQSPGAVSGLSEGRILIACQDEWVEIRSLQLEGKKRLETPVFLNGFKGNFDHVE